jgi:hypothetical protein
VAEVLSESTAYKDWNIKKALYERSETGSVFRYVLKDGRYGPVTEILRGGAAESVAFPGFTWSVPEKR